MQGQNTPRKNPADDRAERGRIESENADTVRRFGDLVQLPRLKIPGVLDERYATTVERPN